MLLAREAAANLEAARKPAAANSALLDADERREQERQRLAEVQAERDQQQGLRDGQPPQQQNLTLEQLQQVVELWTKLQELGKAEDEKQLEMIERLQALQRGRKRSRPKQTPAEANAWWQQYQQQQKLQEMQAEIDRLRQQQRQ